MRIPLAASLAALSLIAVPAASANQTWPDAVSSDNVDYLGSIKEDVGLTTGAKIVGNKMFVTSAKNISIYDISTPESPVRVGFIPNVSWENEEVPTNGKILAVASDFYSAMPNCLPNDVLSPGEAPNGCIQYFDVRDPSNIREIGATQTKNHTASPSHDAPGEGPTIPGSGLRQFGVWLDDATLSPAGRGWATSTWP